MPTLSVQKSRAQDPIIPLRQDTTMADACPAECFLKMFTEVTASALSHTVPEPKSPNHQQSVHALPPLIP
jgi:hypothetical protein